MRIQLAGWRVTNDGMNEEAHLAKARKTQPCSRDAHWHAGEQRSCTRTTAPGQVYVKVRTQAWPLCDDPMSVECAEAVGWVERQGADD